jgi:hypothetical protein
MMPAGIVHLADIHAGLGAQHRLTTLGKGATPPAAVRAELAIVFGLGRAAIIGLDIAARHDPVAAQRQARR